jgi:arginase
MNRRSFLTASLSVAAAPSVGAAVRRKPIDVIEAPTNLGLRPDDKGRIPSTDKAAGALIDAGLLRHLRVRTRTKLHQLPYVREGEPGTKLRNGSKIRAFNLELADAVERSRRRGGFPLVIGGECSDLLGGVLGLRRTGGRGLVHIDGHSDFLQPEFYPKDRPLHSAAGMDLALATGRGEPLLTEWPGVEGALVADADAFQIGERYSDPPEEPVQFFKGTQISQITEQKARKIGIARVEQDIRRWLDRRKITAAWLHIDVDVLDQSIMPAVDSPGTPGLGFAELRRLVRGLLVSGRIAGADIAIYDPALDPDRTAARGLAASLGTAFALV